MQQDIASELSHWSSAQVRQWIASLEHREPPRSVNWWLGVRQCLQPRAYDSELSAEERREWGELVLLLTAYSERFAGEDPWQAAIDRFHMRGLLIRELGSVAGDPAWDLAVLVRDVLATTTLTIGQARELAEHWSDLPIEQIRVLRRHKNLFAPLVPLAERLPDGDEAEQVIAWLALRPALP